MCFDDSLNTFLFYFQIVTAFLLFVSETLGLSSCKYNGVLHFMFDACHRTVHFNCFIDEEKAASELQNSERQSSITDSFHSIPLDEYIV